MIFSPHARKERHVFAPSGNYLNKNMPLMQMSYSNYNTYLANRAICCCNSKTSSSGGGATGPAGPAGPEGPQGIQGATGSTGPQKNLFCLY